VEGAFFAHRFECVFSEYRGVLDCLNMVFFVDFFLGSSERCSCFCLSFISRDFWYKDFLFLLVDSRVLFR